MVVKKITTIILLCLPLLLQAQKKGGKALLDSLLTELPKTKDDTNKVILLMALSNAYYSTDLDEALKYSKLAVSLADGQNNETITGRAYNTLGGAYGIQGNNMEALKNHTHALELLQQTGNKRRIGDSYVFIGNCYYSEGNYPESIKNFLAALKNYEEVGHKQGIIMCYNNIGSIYRAEKDYDKSLAGYAAGMKLIDTSDKLSLATYMQNIGNIYMDEAKYPECVKYESEALKIFEQMGDKNGVAGTYSNIGSVNSLQGNYTEALNKYLTASKLFEEVGNKYSLCTVLGDVGVEYYELGKYADAEKYFQRDLKVGTEIGALPQIQKANEQLSELYEHTGKYKQSFETYKAAIAARDSILNSENTKKILQAQMQYDFDKKESLTKVEQAKKDAVLKLKLQRKNILIYGALSAFTALLIIGTLIFRQNKLHAEKQKTELEQKQLRAQMNPHFIFNCLNSIQHFIVAGDVKNANKYLTGFALLMRQTLENSKAGAITLRREIEYLENYLVLERMRYEDKFTYEIVCAETVNKDRVELPSMIIQPFVENAIRHGLCYLEDRPGILQIRFYEKDRSLYCEVDDNGIGREHSHKLKMASETVYESHGMELTRQRLALVSRSLGSGYSIEIHDKKDARGTPAGTTVLIKFPVES